MGWRCSGLCGALALVALLWGCCWGLEPGGAGDPDTSPETSPHSDPDPREALHRHKRSWVWNQFFVLEEYTANEPLYVGKYLYISSESDETSPLWILRCRSGCGSSGTARQADRSKASPPCAPGQMGLGSVSRSLLSLRSFWSHY
ncbi:Cadherin-20 [Liparis tanakae]|uniref:Cadherin-20 n=1 Tax=Liparis tanakae TaxID=230148 RepID=A0A4Z2GQI5_9TELE|nr:Cadherin-20 [Liparis tanakae]